MARGEGDAGGGERGGCGRGGGGGGGDRGVGVDPGGVAGAAGGEVEQQRDADRQHGWGRGSLSHATTRGSGGGVESGLTGVVTRRGAEVERRGGRWKRRQGLRRRR